MTEKQKQLLMQLGELYFELANECGNDEDFHNIMIDNNDLFPHCLVEMGYEWYSVASGERKKEEEEEEEPMNRYQKLEKEFPSYEIFSTGGGFASGIKEMKGIAIEIHENGINVYINRDDNSKLLDLEGWKKENEEYDGTNFLELHSFSSHLLTEEEGKKLVESYFTNEELEALYEESRIYTNIFWNYK